MDTSMTLATKPAVATPYVAEQQRPADQKVPVVRGMDASATLPSDKAFVAQVVTARLSGTAFPENPGEIAPPDRTLRPYNVPMLPAEKEEPEAASEEPDEAQATDKLQTAAEPEAPQTEPIEKSATEEVEPDTNISAEENLTEETSA